MYGYIYLTINTVNGKKYIGKHKGDKLDPKYKGSGTIISKAISKYGFNKFTCEIIDCADSIEELNEKEKHWIQKYNAVLDKNFYNLVTGGDGVGAGKDSYWYGKHHTEESKQKIREAKLGTHFSEETKRKISENTPRLKGINSPHYGKPAYFKHHTEESKKKISQSKQGKYEGENNPMYGVHRFGKSNPNSKSVVKLDMNGNFVQSYECILDTGVGDPYCVTLCCRKEKKSYLGFIWMYKDDYEAMVGGN